MKITPEHNERMAKMTFASVYPHYITKVERKGRTIDELHQICRMDPTCISILYFLI
jgi:hypothetical protein